MAPARSLQKMNAKMAELSKDIADFTEDKKATVQRNEVENCELPKLGGSSPWQPCPA